MQLANNKKLIVELDTIRSYGQLLIFFFLITLTAHAQNHQSASLNLGDPAPTLRVSKWIKGTPVQNFQKGHVYVLEFWATWCKPCIEAMPHLSDLAKEYKSKVTFIGIDIYEGKIKSYKSVSQVKAFVDSMGQRMDYPVAIEDSSFTVADWMEAAGVQGIPSTFVVDGEGRLAWIGHPTEVDQVLRKIVNNTWDVIGALAERNEYSRLWELEHSLFDKLNGFVGDPNKRYDLGEPDSALLLIGETVKREPKLKYAPSIAFHTFSSLLKTDLNKAYEYGKQLMAALPSYRGTDYDAIIKPIEWSEKTNLVNLSAKFFELGAEAYLAKIDQYPSSTYLPKFYMKIADWYWRGKNKAKATEAAQKAIEAMKNEKTF